MTSKEIYQGKIKWFNPVKAYGFIVNDNGDSDIFFHLNSIVDIHDDQLLPETPVSFTIGAGKKGGTEAFQVWAKGKKDLLTTILGQNNAAYNASLLAQLLAGVPRIDNEPAFGLAKQLLLYAGRAGITAEMTEHCFRQADMHYRIRFWLEGLFDYCDLAALAEEMEKAGTDFKKMAAERLSSYSLGLRSEPPKVLFENIQVEIIKELNSAQREIRAAIAWFTHEKQFHVLMKKLKQGVKVELVIINDYINNWALGLPFKDFVAAGGHLYMSGPERIMHHKFCLVDERLLINGSYNWTYYAEERNQENCMFFYNNEALLASFSEEFDQLTAGIEPVKDVMPPPFAPERYDLFSRRMYQSLDLQFRAQALPAGRRNEAVKLLREAVTINPDNTPAQRMLQQWVVTDESVLKAQAVNQTQTVIKAEISRLQEQVVPTPVPVNANPTQPSSLTDLSAMLVVMDSLKQRAFQGQRGKLRINLLWNTQDDLDLHVIDPDGTEIFYSSPTATCQGYLGKLDTDANANITLTDEPQENIFWEAGTPVGLYKVSVVHYTQRQLERVPFAVSIIPEIGEPVVLTGIITYSAAQKAAVQVAELTYSTDKGMQVNSLLPIV